MSVESEIIGFVIGFGGTVIVSLIIYYFKFIRKKSYSYLLEFGNDEIRSKR
jgi:galactitol-specific phosphotransferase system IIC component